MRWRFGRFELLTTERLLLDGGQPVAIGSRAFDLLMALIERRDRLVGKAELLDLVWPGLVVEESNLPVQVSGLRRLMGSSVIATVPGRGYRFAMRIDDEAIAAHAPNGRTPDAAAIGSMPVAHDVLIGRSAEVLALPRWLAQHRLVTVLGAGGIGKTRVAQAAAQASLGAFPNGVWWVDLAVLVSNESVAPGIAAALRLPLDEGDATKQLAFALSHCKLLLVLDNCEHVAAEVARIVHALLGGTAHLTVLATSQELLRVEGEHVYPLGPLAVPPVGASLAAARDQASVQLLEHRARAVDPRFTLTDEGVALAVDLCRRLDGMALAIEMAAARLPVLGLQALHDRLGDRLNLLRAASREAPSRQRTLRATLDWSHDLLDADARAVLRRLAIFGGSFRLDAALRTAAFGGLDGDAVLEALEALVEKSFVKLDELDPPRYRLAETTRLYALERLGEADEADAALRCHDAYLDELLIEIERSPLSDAALLQRHAADQPEVAAAFDRAIARQDPAAAAPAAMILRALDHLRGDLSAAVQRVRAIDTLPKAAAPAAQARLSFFVASCGWFRGRTDRLDAAREAVRLWKGLGDAWETYRALGVQASEACQVGSFDEAERALQDAAQLEDPAWPARWRAHGALRASMVAKARGDREEALAHLREAEGLFDQAGARALAALTRIGIAASMLEAGDVAEASALAQTATDDLLALGNRSFLGVALALSLRCRLAVGDLAAACAAASRALPVTEAAGALAELADPLALLVARLGNCRAAARLLGHADALRVAHRFTRDDALAGMAARADAAIQAALGAHESDRLRASGAGMSTGQAMTLARQVLAAAAP